MSRTLRWLVVGVACGLGGACGGGEEPEPQVARAEPVSGGEAPRRAEDEPQIEGLMGTLPQFAIQSALEPRMGRFARCFAARSGDVEMLGGRFEMTFRVAVDGSVKWVYPKTSTVGDRETEECMLDIASKVRFRRPSGGEAEFTWPLEFDPPEDIRPAVAWDPAELEEVLGEQGPVVLEECAAGVSAGYTVTAYVAPGGAILAAGASTNGPEAAAALDCVSAQVKAWDVPDPGSYPAKVTFDVGP